MVIVNVISGNILDSNSACIAHQCNCVTSNAKGFAYSIALKYPYADVYKKRIGASKPGTIELCTHDDIKNPIIICMFAQYYPGKVKNICEFDSASRRLTWFEECVQEIEKKGITDITMPYFIGCGLAGGKWDDYREILNKSKLKVTLYKQ